MSNSCSDLCICLVEEMLGPVAGRITKLLLSSPLPLPLIIHKSGLPSLKVRQALCILLQHEMVYFTESAGRITYTANPKMMVSPIQYPKCILLAKNVLGESAESIVEELICHGQLTGQHCIHNVHIRLLTDLKELEEVFVKLVGLHFITRCEDVNISDESNIPCFTPPKDPFMPPHFYESSKVDASRKRKQEDSDEGLWKLNWDKLLKMRRDMIMQEIVANLFDQENDSNPSNILQAALKLNESKGSLSDSSSALLSAHDVIHTVRTYNDIHKNDTMDHRKADVYLNLITDHQSRFFRKTGDSGGGIYTIDFSAAFRSLCCCTLESIIREKFGSRSVRIFRVIIAHNYLEQGEIEQLTMLPSKDGKDLLYELLSNHFISVKEVCKTNDYAPSKSFYLFHVDLQSVSKMQLNLTNSALRNVILRRKSEVKDHKSLIDRQDKVETIVANIQADDNIDDESKATQISEVEQAYLTVAEKELLEKHKKNVLKLHQAQMHLEKTHYILQSFLFIPKSDTKF